VDVKDKGKQTSNLSSDQQMFVEEIKNLQEIVSNLRTEMDDLKLKY
jgi:hypothetical protein